MASKELLSFDKTFALYVNLGNLTLGIPMASGLPSGVAGVGNGPTQIEEVESTNVSQCSDDREHP